jgi:hypothetical protein
VPEEKNSCATNFPYKSDKSPVINHNLLVNTLTPEKAAILALEKSLAIQQKQASAAAFLEAKPNPFFKNSFYIVLTWAIPVILAYLTLCLTSPEKPSFRSYITPAQPVGVSSYTRSDGTPVSGYVRALPGERALAEVANEPTRTKNRQEYKRFEQGKSVSVFFSIVVFLISIAVSKRYFDEKMG